MAEGTEQFTIKLVGATGGNFENLVVAGAGAGGDVTTSLIDDDTASVVIGDATSVTEAAGNYLVYDVKLSNPVATNTTVTLNLSGTATSGADYNGLQYYNGTSWTAVPANNQITLPANGNTVQVRVAVLDDALTESSESVILGAGSSSNPLVTTGDTGTGSILDDRGTDNPNVDADTTASVVIGDATSVTEAAGNYLVYDVKLSNPVATNTTVMLNLSGTATSGADYNGLQYYNGTSWTAVPANNQITLPANGNTVQVRVAVLDDALTESSESVILGAGSSSNPLVTTGDTGTGSIADEATVGAEDTVYARIVNAAGSVTEGGALTHRVELVDAQGNLVTVPTGGSVKVTLLYSADTTSSADFSGARVTSVTIPAGQSSVLLSNQTFNDAIFEGNEGYTLTLDTVTDVSSSFEAIAKHSTSNSVVGTITDNETAPTLSVSSTTVGESAGYAVFDVKLSTPSALTTTVSLGLANNTATGGGVDYGASGAGNLQVSSDGGLTWKDATSYTFVPGSTSVKVRTPIIDDTRYEPTGETFTLQATTTSGQTSNVSATGTATITDNDSQPSLSVSDAFIAEGGRLAFVVSLSNPSSQSVSVNYATGVPTTGANFATAGTDYTATNGTLTFNAGETSKIVYVQTVADSVQEPNERLALNLTASVNASIADGEGIGTIMERVQAVPDSATVYESALASGTVPSSTGETVSGNLLGNDYTPSGTLRVDQVTFGGTNYSIASGGSRTITTSLGSLQVFSNGNYVYTLNHSCPVKTRTDSIGC